MNRKGCPAVLLLSICLNNFRQAIQLIEVLASYVWYEGIRFDNNVEWPFLSFIL